MTKSNSPWRTQARVSAPPSVNFAVLAGHRDPCIRPVLLEAHTLPANSPTYMSGIGARKEATGSRTARVTLSRA